MLHLQTTIVTKGLARVNARVLKRALKAMYLRLGAFWHSTILPKHFTAAGAAEYGYRTRTKEHKREKRNRHGQTDPLVFTGNLKRMALRERRVSATAKGAKVKLRLPVYANFHDIALELTKVSSQDRKRMIAFARKALVEELKREARSLPPKRERCF